MDGDLTAENRVRIQEPWAPYQQAKYLIHVWVLPFHPSPANVQLLMFHMMCTWSFLSTGVCGSSLFSTTICLSHSFWMDIQWQFVNKRMKWNLTLTQIKCLKSQWDSHSYWPRCLLDPEQEAHWFNSICFCIATVWTLISILMGLFAFTLTIRKVLRACWKEGPLF